MRWLTNLFQRKPPPDRGEPSFQFGDLGLFPSGVTQERAKTAMPETEDLPPLLELVPPPLTIGTDESDDYGPDPSISVVARFPAQRVFKTEEIEDQLYGDFANTIHNPTYFVTTPDGKTTYLTAADAPPEGQGLLASCGGIRRN